MGPDDAAPEAADAQRPPEPSNPTTTRIERLKRKYGPALEDVVADIAFVQEEAHTRGGAMLLVPHVVTVSHRPAPASTVDLLVRDALRRSGLVVTAEVDTEEGRLLECRPAGTGPTGPSGSA